jgi:DHA1 family multidrug resistance protein-like MFS transporter
MLDGRSDQRPLTLAPLISLLVGFFSITLGYGIFLPALPFLIERLLPVSDRTSVASHTGLLTGTYMLAIFFFAPIWGRVSDRLGRRPVIILGLAGYAAALVVSASIESLSGLYAGRFMAGLFSSAVAPASYALVGDHASSREVRARHQSLLNIVGTAGFLIGPLMGGIALQSAREIGGITVEWSILPPSLISVVVALAGIAGIWTLVPKRVAERGDRETPINLERRWGVIQRLLSVSFATAFAIGAFEVAVALRGKEVLAMTPAQIGMIFVECSVVMLIAQVVVFSPLVKASSTRKIIVPALVMLAAGMFAMPLTDNFLATMIATAIIAAAAGVLSPVVVYWMSLEGNGKQGTDLGLQTAAASLGQTIGSALGGFTLGLAMIPSPPFTVAGAIVLISLLFCVGLTSRLKSEPT